jgi:hypothetical protein
MTVSSLRPAVLTLVWLAIAAWPLVEGYSYYRTPLLDRPYSADHTVFRPSGLVGQGLGIAGSLMMLVGVGSYSARKRVAALQRFGKLRKWLTFHIFLCTLGPFLVLLHTSFKFGNIASISFWSMAVVVASGVFGRYVYVRIPKTADGRFHSENDLRRARAALSARIAEITGLTAGDIDTLLGREPAAANLVRAMMLNVVYRWRKGQLLDHFREELRRRDVPADRIEAALPVWASHVELQLRQRTLRPLMRAFGYWHVLHIPLALVMLAALLIHIAVAIAFGYTWVL